MSITLKDLAVDHPYYCSDNNYYDRTVSQKYDTWPDFFNEYHDADIDLNLIFRWDIKKRENFESYYMEVFVISQRKGIFVPIYISIVLESDVPSIVEFLGKHFDYLTVLWNPLNSK